MSVQLRVSSVNVDQLVEENLHLVIFTIRNFFYAPNIETKKEMESVGRIGLVKAALGYDPGRAAFNTYAVRRIRSEISHFFRCQKRHQGVASLDQEIGQDGFNLYNVIFDDLAFFESEVTHRTDVRTKVEFLLSGLDKNERELIERYFGIGRKSETQQQIAKDLGVSASCVSNRIRKVMAELKDFVAYRDEVNPIP